MILLIIILKYIKIYTNTLLDNTKSPINQLLYIIPFSAWISPKIIQTATNGYKRLLSYLHNNASPVTYLYTQLVNDVKRSSVVSIRCWGKITLIVKVNILTSIVLIVIVLVYYDDLDGISLFLPSIKKASYSCDEKCIILHHSVLI